MVVFPKAKINIGLRITGKRDDGYHDLQTIFYPVPLCDALEFVVPSEPNGYDTLSTSGLPVNCSRDNNLIIKVLNKLREGYDLPFLSLHLHKSIPMGAGLGGGSSDAAFLLKALNRYFNLGINAEDLKAIALSIGSDCPFFIDCIPSYAEGRGEILTPVGLLTDGLFLVLVNPGINISTREAFHGCVPYKDGVLLTEYYNEDISEWKDKIVNDFEKTLFKAHPVIGQIKDDLYNMGAVYSSLSGSGSTVYGIFRNVPDLHPDMKRMVIYSGRL